MSSTPLGCMAGINIYTRTCAHSTRRVADSAASHAMRESEIADDSCRRLRKHLLVSLRRDTTLDSPTACAISSGCHHTDPRTGSVPTSVDSQRTAQAESSGALPISRSGRGLVRSMWASTPALRPLVAHERYMFWRIAPIGCCAEERPKRPRMSLDRSSDRRERKRESANLARSPGNTPNAAHKSLSDIPVTIACQIPLQNHD